MISLLNEAIDWLVKLLAKTGLLKKDLDYNLLHSVHAEWMGSGSRVSCYGRKCSFPPERMRVCLQSGARSQVGKPFHHSLA